MKSAEKYIDPYDLVRGALFILVCAGTALFYTRFTYDSFELSKNVWVAFWVKALLFVYLAVLIFGYRTRIHLSPILGLLLAYTALHFISGITAGSKSLWWDETVRILLLFIFAILLQDFLHGNRRRLFILIWALSLSSAITAGWALWEDFAGRFFPQLLHVRPRLADWRGYISAGLGNTGFIADYIAVLFPMNLLLYLHARGKPREIYLLFTLLISYAALIVCWSVQSNAGLLIALIVLVYFLVKFKPRRFWKRRFLRTGVLAGGFILITLFYITPIPFNPHKPSIFKQAFSSERWEFGGESRLVIWAQSLEIVKNNPWLGAGAGNFTWEVVQQSSPFLQNDPQKLSFIGSYTNSAHNEILQSWGELGVAGPALLAILLIVVIKELLKYLDITSMANRWVRIGTFCAIICAVLPAMMAYPLRLPTSSVLFFTICVIPICLVPKTKYFSRHMVIPVELNWKFVSLTVFLKNFQKPEAAAFHFDFRKRIAVFLTVCITVIFAGWLWFTVHPLVSDAWFRKGKILSQMYEKQGRNTEVAEEAEQALRTSLEWWEDNHDCRSALGQFLVRRGKYEEAIRHLGKTLERLQAREIYSNLAHAYEMTGRKQKALQAYETYFQRNPVMEFARPRLFRHFRELKNSLSHNSE